MAAPTFVGAGAAVIIQTGGAAVTAAGSGVAVGDLIVLQVLQDGVAASAVSYSAISGVADLPGTASSLTALATDQPCGTLAKQHLRVGRATSTTVTVTATTTGDDLYSRIYVFRGVAPGGNLADILENGSAGSFANGSGATAAVTDTGVVTLGIDRLALQFVGVDDDNPLAAFTGMSGGTWVEAIAEFASATGTDAAIQLQTATKASAGTIDGGSQTMAAADNWGVIGFALKPVPAPAVLEQEAYRFRNDDGSETAATWQQPINTPEAIVLNTTFRVRFAVENTGGDTSSGYVCQYRRKPSGGAFGAWADLGSNQPINIAASTFITAGEATTQQISAGAFSPGKAIDNSILVTGAHREATWTEVEFSVRAITTGAAPAANGDVIEFRLVIPTGRVPLDTYTQTPSLTVGTAGPVTVERSVSLDATGGIATVGREQLARTVVLSATGLVASSGARVVPATERSAALTVTGLIASAGRELLPRSAALNAAGLVASRGIKIRSRSVALAATGSIAAAGRETISRSAALSATASIASAGRELARLVELGAAAQVSVSGQVEGGLVVVSRSAGLSATGGIASVGRELLPRRAVVTATASVATVARRRLHRSSAVTATGQVAVAGEILGAVARSATLAATATVTAVPRRSLQRSATVSTAPTVSAVARRTLSRTAVLQAVAAITTTSGKTGQAEFTAIATITLSRYLEPGYLTSTRAGRIAVIYHGQLDGGSLGGLEFPGPDEGELAVGTVGGIARTGG